MSEQKTVRGVQLLDMVFDMPVLVHVVFVVLKTVEVPQLQYFVKVVDVFFVLFIDVLDVPVILQRRFLVDSRGASDSVHRQSRGIAGCLVVTVQKTVEVLQFLFSLAMRTTWVTCPCCACLVFCPDSTVLGRGC